MVMRMFWGVSRSCQTCPDSHVSVQSTEHVCDIKNVVDSVQ